MELYRRLNWIIFIILVSIGLSFILMGIFQYDFFRNFLCVIIGIGMIVFNIPSLIFSLYGLGLDTKRGFIFLSSIIGIGLGAFYIPFHGTVMSFVCGAFLLILPTVRIIFEREHFKQFKKEIFLYIIGIFLTLNMLDIMFQLIVVIAGIVIIVFAIYGLVSSYAIMKRAKKKDSINADIIVNDVELLQIEDNKENVNTEIMS